MKKNILLITIFFLGILNVYSQKNEIDNFSTISKNQISNSSNPKNEDNATLLFNTDLTQVAIIGIEFDQVRGGLLLAREDDGIIYLMDTTDWSVMETYDVASIGIAEGGQFEAIDVLPNGNLLLGDLNGDMGTNIESYILEVNIENMTLVNYWPIEGAMNTSTDGTEIVTIVGIEVSENGNFIVCTGNSSDPIYEISTTPGLPGTWETVATHTKPPSITLAMGIDRYEDYYVISDYSSNNISITDAKFNELFYFSTTHHTIPANLGVCFSQNQTPIQIIVHGLNGLIGIYQPISFSSINCPENQNVTADNSNFYTVQGINFDPNAENTSNIGFTITNDYNNTETLENEQLEAGTYTITWTMNDDFGYTEECSFEIIVDEYSDIENNTENAINISPNPTNGFFNINCEQSKVSKIEIHDITGKIIYSNSEINNSLLSININNKPNGIYFIKINTENNIITKKIIKQ